VGSLLRGMSDGNCRKIIVIVHRPSRSRTSNQESQSSRVVGSLDRTSVLDLQNPVSIVSTAIPPSSSSSEAGVTYGLSGLADLFLDGSKGRQAGTPDFDVLPFE
jgi:hypothetical protein